LAARRQNLSNKLFKNIVHDPENKTTWLIASSELLRNMPARKKNVSNS
jgi:hypothetical protein